LGSRIAAWVIGVLLTLGLAAIMKSRIVGALNERQDSG
jgi:hypothetical protein